jgi:DNA polymerase III psi subunit
MPKKSVADHSMEWRLLLDSIEPDTQEAAFMKELLFELRTVRDTVLQLDSERLALIARKQQITKDLNALKTRGRSVAARVRSGLLTQLGHDSEQLTAHGMKPRRRRTRAILQEQETLERLTNDPVS